MSHNIHSENSESRDSNDDNLVHDLVEDNGAIGGAEDENDIDAIGGAEDENDIDAIGDTVFSKHWLFQCLIKTLEMINREPSSSDGPIELDSDAEEELCVLWDMSANEDVAKFLIDFKAIDLFEGIIVKTNSPRLAEISAGILANIANNSQICVTMSNKHGFRDLILSSLQSSDTPFVLQLIRLITTVLSNNDVQSLWISSISCQSDQFFSTIQYTLENCLNSDVLKSVLVLIHKVLYRDDSLTLKWLQMDNLNECGKCLLQACEQIILDNDDNIDCIDHYWLILHMLSLADDEFVITYLLPIVNEQYMLFDRYINGSFGESVDYIVASGARAGSLAAALSIINQLMSLSSSIKRQLLNNNDLIECFRNLRVNCSESLDHNTHTTHESYHLALEQLNAIVGVINESEMRKNSIANEATR